LARRCSQRRRACSERSSAAWRRHVELAARAREVCPSLRLVFMSGYADSALMRRGPIHTGAHFIQKPFTAAALGRKVREAIDAPPAG
jgi:FixJ family two-component response regulator